MGYYTDYKLQIVPYNQDIYDHFLNDTGYVEDDSTKWYDWKEDCESISKSNLGYLFILSGEGENTGDIWKAAFLNGELVWKWHLDNTIPEVPKEIMEKAEIEFAIHQGTSVKEQIEELENRIAELRKYLIYPES